MPRLLAVMGPTASGKTAVAEALADDLNAVLINADAFQVYRGMDIGTAKPDDRARYRLLDLKEPSEPFGLGEWVALAHAELTEAFQAGKSAIVVGGTGLYIRALFEEYAEMAATPNPELRAALMERELPDLVQELQDKSPELAARTDLLNPTRIRRALERLADTNPPKHYPLPAFRVTKLVIERQVGQLNELIASRVERMMHNGWLEEVENLKNRGYGPGDPGFRALGYSSLWKHLAGELTLTEALETTVNETRRYAKRQRSWLRKEPNATAIPGEDFHQALQAARDALTA